VARRLLEVRTYRLKAGAGPLLHEAFIRDGIPLVKQAGMDVVAFGFSADDPDGYFLLRAFADLHDRKATEGAFYSSDAWRKGPRQSIIAHIDSYQDTLLWLSPEAVEQLRTELAAASRP